MPAIFTDAWITRGELLLYRGVGAVPNPAKFFFCASALNTLTRASTLAEFINAELPPLYGYQRQQVLWAANGAFDNVDKRHELPTQTITITAPSDASLSFQTVFLLADGHSKASENASPSNISGSTITIAGNLLSNGDAVIPVADAGGSVPSPLVAGTAYTAINVNSSTGAFQVSSDGITAITLTNTGAGTFRFKYASGTPVLLQVESPAIVLQPGRPVQYDIDLVGMNTTYAAGV